MKPPEKGKFKEPARDHGKTRRIETQIHRRRKVKTTLPLAAEWDAASDTPSTTLRTPSEKMKNQFDPYEPTDKDDSKNESS